jgi:hypothetical protein
LRTIQNCVANVTSLVDSEKVNSAAIHDTFRKEASLSKRDAKLEAITSVLVISKDMMCSGGAVAFESNETTKQMPSSNNDEASVKKPNRADHDEDASNHCIHKIADQDQDGEERGLLLDGKSDAVGKENDDTPSISYPLDGRWEMSWKSFPGDTATFVVHKHKFEMFEYPCEIKMKGPEDGFCPNFQWPVAATSVTNPVFQKSKLAIPPGMKSTKWPTIIEWTTTDSGYGEITWTKPNATSSRQSDIRDRKRAHQPSYLSESEVPIEVPIKKRIELEEFAMESSIPGKAWGLVEGAISLQTEDMKTNGIEIIAQDDIIFLAERFMRAQQDFNKRKIPCHVDIAYHHTRSENLQTIQTKGLLSCSERAEQNVYSKYNGSTYGDGIYCSTDPKRHAHGRYGDTTILLARMCGIESFDKSANNINTYVNIPAQFCALRSSKQCIPLFRFPVDLLRATGNDYMNFRKSLSDIHKKVQRLLDKIFYEHQAPQTVPPFAAIEPKPRASLALIAKINILPESISYIAPESRTRTENRDFCKPALSSKELFFGCPNCIESLVTNGKVVQISKCGHVFHSKCIEKSMETNPYCPVCHTPISSKHWCGTMPSASMSISQCRENIKILYNIPPGIQKKYHPNPGQSFYPDFRIAYVPATVEGGDLLKRLKFAFSRGLTFGIGTCLFTGRCNSIFWGVVTHSTLPHSRLDPSFISKSNDELDRLHVPPAMNL